MSEEQLNDSSWLLELEEAEPTGLLPALERLLEHRFAARSARLWMVDYRMAVLQAMDGGAAGAPPAEQRPVEGSVEGRVFASQEPSAAPLGRGAHVVVPVTAPSNRLGVLGFVLDRPPDSEQLSLLTALGRSLARSITVAGRHTDQFERAARAQRLSLAAELQWQILPGRGCRAEEFELAGQLEPAYHVAGDAFDWNLSPQMVTVSVHEGMGHGTAAAQATNLAVTALRNARRAGLSPGDQATMAHEALYGEYGGRHRIETLLLAIHRETGRVTAVDAGSPLLLCQRADGTETVTLQKQLPLGQFEGTRYSEDTFSVAPGDRLVVVTDGVFDAPGPRGARFGDARLGKALRETRHLSAAEAVRHLISDLRDWSTGGELDDDAVAVVVDWKS